MTKKRPKKVTSTNLEVTLETLRRLSGAPGVGGGCGDKSNPCHAGSCHPPPPSHNHCPDEHHKDPKAPKGDDAIIIVPSKSPQAPDPKQ